MYDYGQSMRGQCGESNGREVREVRVKVKNVKVHVCLQFVKTYFTFTFLTFSKI